MADRGADMVATPQCAQWGKLNCNRCCNTLPKNFVPLTRTEEEDLLNRTASAPEWQRRVGPDGQAYNRQESADGGGSS